MGRYEHVAAAFVDRGAAVYGPDHLGHGEKNAEGAGIEPAQDSALSTA